MGATRRGRTIGLVGVVTTALVLSVVPTAVADGPPGVPVLEPEVVLVEGRSATLARIDVVDVAADAVLFAKERGGHAVAYGPDLAFSRDVTTEGRAPELASGWVVDAWIDYWATGPVATVVVGPVTGGESVRHELPSLTAFVAANAEGWVEIARTEHDVRLLQVTIGPDGSITRADIATLFEAPEGADVEWAVAVGADAPSGTTVGFTLQVDTGGDALRGVFLYTSAPEPVVEALEPLGANRSRRLEAVSEDAVLVSEWSWSGSGTSTVLQRLGGSEPQEWRTPPGYSANTVSLVGDRVFAAVGGGSPYTRQWLEAGADGAFTPITGPWAQFPAAGVTESPSGVFFAVGHRLLATDVDRTTEKVVVEAGVMPLDIRAFDLEAGTAVWVDDSVAQPGSGTAWSRSLMLAEEPTLLVERATGIAIKRMHGTTFVYQTNDEGRTFDLLKAPLNGTTGVVGTAWSGFTLAGEARTLLAGGVFTDLSKPDALVDVATGAVTPSVRLRAISDSWRVSVTEAGWPTVSTITATPAAGGSARSFTVTEAQGGFRGVEVVGHTLVWLTGGYDTPATLHRVDLSTPTSVVQDFPVTGDALTDVDRHHVATSRTEADGTRSIDIYRWWDGDLEPVATLADVVFHAVIDGGRVLWAEKGPDGDRLVAARIPGASLFTDVPPESAFATEIEWLVESGIGTGYVDGTFRPGGTVSRQAMAAFLFRAERPDFTAPTAATFADVPPSSPFFREIEWMVDAGLATTTDGRFRPGDPVSRQAMAAYLYRAAGSPEFTAPVTPTFTDVPATSAFFAEIEWLAQTGITAGYADHTFRPGGQVSRQAMAAFLHRFEDLRG